MDFWTLNETVQSLEPIEVLRTKDGHQRSAHLQRQNLAGPQSFPARPGPRARRAQSASSRLDWPRTVLRVFHDNLGTPHAPSHRAVQSVALRPSRASVSARLGGVATTACAGFTRARS